MVLPIGRASFEDVGMVAALVDTATLPPDALTVNASNIVTSPSATVAVDEPSCNTAAPLLSGTIEIVLPSVVMT